MGALSSFAAALLRRTELLVSLKVVIIDYVNLAYSNIYEQLNQCCLCSNWAVFEAQATKNSS